jgi:hypothetical protein
MDEKEITQLLMPQAMEQYERLKAGGRLVHYTNAEAAYRIIQGQQIWLRNASMMNDFSEIQHGINCLSSAWISPSGKRLQEMLNRLSEGLSEELANLFDGHAEAFRRATFITSLSEHDDAEDQFGRLSMWRAYGGRAGVALVLNSAAFTSDTGAMKVFSSPVFYKDITDFTAWFQGWADAVVAAEERLRLLGAEGVRNVLFMAFRNFALCTKHPGFAEEREWRVFSSPTFEGASDWLQTATEVIGGLPQHVLKLSLRDDESQDIIGVAPSSLINRVIIGPCEHPMHVRAAIADALTDAGVLDATSKLWMSFIPLRHS